MKRFSISLIVLLFIVSVLILGGGCGEKEKSQQELAVGNWLQIRNRAFILWVTNPKGEWSSSVKIPDVTGKIVRSKGSAKGTWHIESGQMIVTVVESDVEQVWQKNATNFYDIVDLKDEQMQLREATGRVAVWNKTITKKSAAQEITNPLIPMGPLVVNINKHRSHDKDRYLCINMNLMLKEMMPDQDLPAIHPQAREAALIFLSAVVFNDVKDFTRIKNQKDLLKGVLNPYLDDAVKEIKIEHVIVTTDPDKVEEFVIEHTLTETGAEEEKESSETGDKEADKKEDLT